MPIITELTELVDERISFGGNTDAINKHSQRRYEFKAGGVLVATVLLDRTLDALPKFYTAWLVTEQPLSPHLKVMGQEYWGDGMPWKRAERLLYESLTFKYRNFELMEQVTLEATATP